MSVNATALAWHAAGFSVIPIRDDGTKSPALPSWDPYKERLAGPVELGNWFRRDRDGYGIVCGAVSGNLEMFEFEGRAAREGHFERFERLVADNGLTDTWLTVKHGYAELTPSGGHHYLYRVSDGPALGNTKLARRPSTDAELAKDPKAIAQLLIETRGEGGQTVMAPSGGTTHDSGLAWMTWPGLPGTPGVVPSITAAQRDALYVVARMLNEVPDRPPAPPRATGPRGDGPETPMECYNRTVAWADILEPHGWQYVCNRGDISYWLRPGKDPADLRGAHGWSASTNYEGTDTMYVWSSSVADLDHERAMSKAYVSAALNYGGDMGLMLSYWRDTQPKPGAPTAAGVPGKRAPLRALGDPRRPRVLAGDWDCASSHAQPFSVANRWIEQTDFILHYWRDSFYRWSDGVYKPLEDGEMSRILWHDLDLAHFEGRDKKGNPKSYRFTPTDAKVRGVRAALQSLCYREGHWSPDPVIAFRNGVLDLATGAVSEHRPQVFNVHRINADYDPNADCPSWLDFVTSSLPERDQQDCLQEIVGYLLSGRGDLHKIFGFWGQKRSGKSTILRILRAILGDRAVAGASLASLCGGFGLAGIRDASIIEIGEARFTRENKPAMDILLKISGRDGVEVNVKNKAQYTATLPGRIVMHSNEMPNLRDDSGAFATRFVHVAFNVSFLGREDRGIEKRCLEELAGIVAWGMRGLARLDANDGRFTDTEASRALDRQLKTTASHAGTWFEDCCERADAGTWTPVGALQAAYEQWCDDHDVELQERFTEKRLGRFLSSTVVGSKSKVVKSGGHCYRERSGVRLVASGGQQT